MGYVHANISQVVPCTSMLPVTGTWTEAVGAVAGTICKHKAAAPETATVYIPLDVLSSATALKGSMINSIEVDYEVLIAACTSVTATLKKITRGAEGAVAVVSTITTTQSLVAATAAATVDQHRLVVSVTTPAYINDDEIYQLEVAFVAAATTTLDVLAAVVNLTQRL